MITSESFKDYTLLDAGDKEKLENWKGVILRRPDPMAIWPKTKPELWEKADAVYHRSHSGGGSWEYKNRFPESWNVNYRELVFKVSPTGFKHTGLFPEQAANWDFIYERIQAADRPKILNLFAYTGAATMVAAAAGAEETVHLDASKGINEWAKENMNLSKLQDKTIRFIVDDALKFTSREIRRGRRYDGIIMDPPSYGRGPDNELFRFEDKINPLICNCLDLLSDKPLFFIINTYTTGYSPTVMYNLMKRHTEERKLEGKIIADEIGISMKDSDYVLPCGQTTRWYR
ncbi:MAG: class I SAM-dependent methyltransferase [Erysipelotrichaceae bacterium]|nr:class I SAM-dependent methyltransferase [Erysipelotrichaceae bacterium]MBQ6494106.1 class I SAM-dependent methyltransferase [Erysipelotrichaceae bacterium]